MKRMLVKKVLRFFWQSFIVGVVTLLLFEAAFRLYVIDFYKGGFDTLNSDFEQRDEDLDLMIIGDSFSAFKAGYPQVLYDSLSDFNLHNMSVAGTSVREQYLFGRHHLKRVNPDVLIFQFYVGNDLFSWKHVSGMKGASLPRKVYWKLSERLWSLSFLNHSLAGLKSKGMTEAEMTDFVNGEFDPLEYTTRDKIYFQAEPRLVENASLLKGGRGRDLLSYMERMEELFGFAKDQCEIYILLMPHCAQVNNMYRERATQIGAEFSKDFKPGLDTYPLYDQMEDFFSEDSRVKVLNPILKLKGMEEMGRSAYLNNDSHLNLAGQRLIGGYILEEMSK